MVSGFAAQSIAQKVNKHLLTADSFFVLAQYETAIKYYDSALKISPADHIIPYRKGICYYNIQKSKEAKASFDKALQQDPRCLYCEYFLISLLADAQQTDAALHKADSVLKLYADTGKKYNSYIDIKAIKAHIYWGRGQLEKAGAVYDELVVDYPDTAAVYFARAEFNYAAQKKSGALKDVGKAIELKPNVAAYHFLKAKIYLSINYYKETLPIINKAIELDGTVGEYYGYRGGIHHYLRNFDEALNDYLLALKYNGAGGFYNAKISEFYLMKEDMDSMCFYLQRSKEAFEKEKLTVQEDVDMQAQVLHQIEEFCNNSKPGYYYQRGVAMYNLGLYDSSIYFYTAGLEKFVNQPVMHNFRGNAYMKIGQWAKAEKDYLMSLQNPEELKRTVSERFKLDDPLVNEKYYKGFIASAHLGLSEAYLQMGYADKAIKAADSALNIAPIGSDIPLAEYYNQLGRAYLAAGNYEKALKEFEKVTTLSPENPLGYINMGLATAYKALEVPEQYRRFGFSATWNLGASRTLYEGKPVKLTNNQEMLMADALSYCDKAINLAQQDAQLYLIRAYVKLLANHNDVCTDVARAKALGITDVGSTFNSTCP
jgi:tetratricopeptide (TPR) repeat protein